MSASNFYGESADSQSGNGATIVLVPSSPVSLSDDLSVTTASLIGIKWQNGVSTGGTPILDYKVWYDQSLDDYVVLDDSVNELKYTTTVLLTPGSIYKFKV